MRFSKTSNIVFRSYVSASNSCGVIFDVPRNRALLVDLQAKTSEPDFWQDQERAQRILQQRKAAESRVSAEDKLVGIVSDIETYIQLAKDERDMGQREAVLRDIQHELDAADAYVGQLETETLLAGESDRLNAIVTIKPGAGGTNRPRLGGDRLSDAPPAGRSAKAFAPRS